MTRITPAEAVLLMPQSSLHGAPRNAEAERVAAMIAEARQARDRAMAERIRGFFHSLRSLLTTLRTRRETIEQLRAMSDRELADIGLTRGNITAAAVAATPVAANDQMDARAAA
ncbi:DUF1127 domain-containing protein [Roseococcus sp. SDR]|uniref:DUF1127 domain-containing protein n=1 Tax=Roseococcus sp. SDR TaxID=2835532 RepID=UPI001BCAF185|nr:DUF1127 domain-containing protein [Roseococcus sp. SDR]MBS7791749.1 DUF1127 domain-containing protein [Roseococcus sp. SDR]MBV1847063.1 DUF1127 domain-containing protein [Roseococcus sp. SDR]